MTADLEPGSDLAASDGGPRRQPPDLAQAAEMFRALGDPTRLAIYELIREGGTGPHTASDLRQSVSEVASHFELSLSTVSHHLKELRRAGLIRCERQGRTVYCSTAPDAVDAIRRYLAR